MKSMYRKTKDMQDKKTSCGILQVNSKNYAAVNKHKKMIDSSIIINDSCYFPREYRSS